MNPLIRWLGVVLLLTLGRVAFAEMSIVRVDAGGAASQPDAAVGRNPGEPGSSATEPAVELGRIEVTPRYRVHDLWGINAKVLFRVHGDMDELRLQGRLLTNGGEPVAALAEWSSLRDGQGHLRFKQTIARPVSGAWDEREIFIPYSALRLERGAHQLKLQLEASRRVERSTTGSRWQMVRLTGLSSSSFAIEQPRLKMVQLLVREVQVAPIVADISFGSKVKTLPDLQWRVELGSGPDSLMYASEHLDDRLFGSWVGYTMPIPLCDGDTLFLRIVDHDLLDHDELGVFSFSLAELLAAGETTGPMANGHVQRMLLGPIKSWSVKAGR